MRFDHDPDADPLIGADKDAVRGSYVREALDQASLRETPFTALHTNALTRAVVFGRSAARFGDREALRRSYSVKDAIRNCLLPAQKAICHLLDEEGTHHLVDGSFPCFATYNVDDPLGMLGKTVKFHTGASWLEPHFKYAKEKCGLAQNPDDKSIYEWTRTPVRKSNCRDASHGSVMTATPSTRRLLDGVAVRVLHPSIRSARPRCRRERT